MLWSVTTQGNGLAPGLRYGVAPGGAEVTGDAPPLVAGRRYLVVLRAWLANGPFNGIVADTVFTR